MADGRDEAEDEAAEADARRAASRKGPAGAAPNRVISLERRSGERRSVYVPLKRRARRFLEALEETGNASLACETAGVGKDRIYKLRQADAGFASDWAAAKAAFEARMEAGVELPDEARLREDRLVVRVGRDGRPQIAAAHRRAWTRAREDVFFAEYAGSGNISAAAKAAGFSYHAAWARAAKSPAFAARLAEAKKAAVERLEYGLIEEGTNLLPPSGGGAGADGVDLPESAEGFAAARRDPQLAMWLVKRADAERGAGVRGGRGRRGWPAPRPADKGELIEAIMKQVKVLKLRREKDQREEGWTQSEEGHWIPPGWVRAGA